MWKLNSDTERDNWEKETRTGGAQFNNAMMKLLEQLLQDTDPESLKRDLRGNPNYTGIAVELLTFVEDRLATAAELTLKATIHGNVDIKERKALVMALKIRVMVALVKELVENADKYRSE